MTDTLMKMRCGRIVRILYPIKRDKDGNVLRYQAKRTDKCKHKERFVQVDASALTPCDQ